MISMEDESIIYQEIFKNYQDTPLIIYGTGIIAARIINALKQTHNLYAVMDGKKRQGEFEGLKICDWKDIEDKEKLVLVIAALSNNYRTIFQRIKQECKKRRILIVGAYGEIISAKSWANFDQDAFLDYLKLDINQAKDAISVHDYISFDIFDTLIMRQVYEPKDIFSILEGKFIEDGVTITNFSSIRYRAGFQKNTIYEIYEKIQEETGISDELKNRMLYDEISLEKELIIVREDVKVLFDYAKSLGKRVYLISDMYFSKKILADILSLNGINGWDEIYVSCDYNKRKEEGLYQVYLDDLGEVNPSNCLHFGDNNKNDNSVPRRKGIHVFPLKSARELLGISSLDDMHELTNNQNGRLLIGAIIARLFNSPFSLSLQGGIPIIRRWITVGAAYFSILLIIYIQELISFLNSHLINGKILFAARDGYLFEKVYRSIRRWEKYRKLPQGVYLIISRKIALGLCENEAELNSFLEHYYVLKNHDVKQWMQENNFSQNKAKKRKVIYCDYLKKIGVSIDEVNIFFEVFSMGTAQHFLKDCFKKDLLGYYLIRYFDHKDITEKIESVYTVDDEFQKNYPVVPSFRLFEWCFSSPYPSACEIKESGQIVYDSNERTNEEMAAMLDMQNGAEMVALLYLKYCRNDEELDKGILFNIYSHLYESVYEGETKNIFNQNLTMFYADNFTKAYNR